MFIGIAGFAAYGFLAKSPTQNSIYFEADASGKLRQVERPSNPTAPLPNLWKPEPQILQQHRLLLKLTKAQGVRIESITAEWEKAKEDLLRRIDGETKGTRNGKTSMVAIQSGLGGYAELSRLYDRTRNAYWNKAIAELDSKQKASIEKIRSGVAK